MTRSAKTSPMLEIARRWLGVRNSDDDLVSLMVVAREDVTIRDQLLLILGQPDFHRQSLLNTWISELTMAGAPVSLRRALHSLVDDERAHRALDILQQSQGPGQG